MVSPSAPLHIRTAQAKDYGAIAAIYNEAIALGSITMDTEPYAAVDIEAIVQKMTPRETYLVAAVDERVVGWGVIKRYSDRPGYQPCCEMSIYFTHTATGKGYGQQLQSALMAQASAYGYHHIVAKILAANASSIRFHEKFGFELVGIQKEIGYVNGRWQDVAIMQCLMPH